MTPADPIAVALLVAHELDTLGILYTTGGSIASSIAGEPRSTVDVDLVAALGEEHVAALVSALSREFYVDEHALRRAARERGIANLIHQSTQLKARTRTRGRWMTCTARAALLLTMSAAACAGTSGPIVLSIPDVRAPSVRVGAWIDSYDSAVVSISSIMERDLGLPAIQASLYFYADRSSFQQALELDGYEPAFARDAAATLSGIAGFRRVILNDANLHWLEWPERVALLAHELTHTVQYEFSRGRRSTSEQWLREGFAEWVEVYVMDVLDFTTWNQARAIAAQRVRDAERKQPPPTFAEMVTYPDWVRTVQRSGEAGVYAQALIAADLLIARHGRDAVVGYFRLFEASEDRLANFRAAFGEDLPAFEAVFREHLARIVR